MAISFVGIGTRADFASGTSALSIPLGTVSGDFLVAPCHHRSISTTMAAPTGGLTWADTGSAVAYMKVFTATYGSDPPVITIDSASGATYGVLIVLRCSNPILVDVIDDSGAGQTNMRYPAITPGNDGDFILTYCRTNSAIASVAQDTGFTEIEDVNLSAGVGGVQIQYQVQTAATLVPQGNPVVTGSVTAAVHGITLAFKEGPPVIAAARNLLLGVG